MVHVTENDQKGKEFAWDVMKGQERKAQQNLTRRIDKEKNEVVSYLYPIKDRWDTIW